MPASLRVIKIVANPVTREEDYTLEFEVIGEDAKDLIKELNKSEIGQKLMHLVDKAKFLPDIETEDVKKRLAEEEAEHKEFLKQFLQKALRNYESKKNAGQTFVQALKETIEEEIEGKPKSQEPIESGPI